MKKILVILVGVFCSMNLFAQVEYLTSSGLNVEVQGAKVVNQKYSDIPWDETHTYNVLTYADLELTFKITDVGCGLKNDSKILINYLNHDSNTDDFLKVRGLSFYLTQQDASGYGCAFTSDTVKVETITIPLLNGVSRGADQDIVYKYIINENAGWGNHSVELKVKVNQFNKTAELI